MVCLLMLLEFYICLWLVVCVCVVCIEILLCTLLLANASFSYATLSHIPLSLYLFHVLTKLTAPRRSRDGLQLLMCSTDGTVAFLRLEGGGLRPLSPQEAAEYLRRLYGDAVLASATASSVIIEDPALLALSQEQEPAHPSAGPASVCTIIYIYVAFHRALYDIGHSSIVS